MQDKTGTSSKAQFPRVSCQGQFSKAQFLRVSCQGQSSAMGCVLHRSPQRRNESIGLMTFALKEAACGSCVQERSELSRQGGRLG